MCRKEILPNFDKHVGGNKCVGKKFYQILINVQEGMNV